MSKISKSEIHHVAELAKIHINEPETLQLQEKLNDILNMVEKMQSIDTDRIAPLAHPIAQNQKLREDVSDKENDRNRYQESSSKTDEGFYIVPTVIE